MSLRARRTALAVVAVVAVLFAGRWTAGFLADRWWGASISPFASDFLTQFNLLRLVLDGAGTLAAASWFTGHLLLVHRAIGTVEISRRIANVEVRERLTPELLIAGAGAAGLLLGLLTGGDLSRHWQTVALAWQGVRFGAADPVLGNDAGLYVAQLPLWSMVAGFARLLVLGALVLVPLLYAVVGAVRWIDGRPAINDHARRHVGWLLAALALLLAVGALLDPLRRVGGQYGVPGGESLKVAQVVAPLLAGTCLMAALLSAFWAHRARHIVLVAGWCVLALAFLLGRGLATALVEPDDLPAGSAAARAQADAIAYALRNVQHEALDAPSSGRPPLHPSLWQPDQLVRTIPHDSVFSVALDPTWITAARSDRPVWLMISRRQGEAPRLEAVADDAVGNIGTPLYYQAPDSVAIPAPTPFISLSSRTLYPGSEPQAFDSTMGIATGRWPRRLLLAWALQRGDLLAATPPTSRIAWERRPIDRLRKLAPYAQWGRPVPRVVGERLLWVADGYVSARFFPLSSRATFHGDDIGYVRAPFVGLVDAATGVTRICLRPDPGPIARAWAALSHGVVESWDSLDPTLRTLLGYPADLFRIQAPLLAVPGLTLISRSDSTTGGVALHDVLWETGTRAPVRVAAYAAGSPQRLAAVLYGRSDAGVPMLILRQADSSDVLPTPEALQRQWSRFPSFTQLADSARVAGTSLTAGHVRLWQSGQGVGALQVWYAPLGAEGVSVVWISLAAGGRVGAGRTLAEAWSNLQGLSVPAVPGAAPEAVLLEARKWLRQADSALRAGDLSRFGRAFEALRQLLESRPTPR